MNNPFAQGCIEKLAKRNLQESIWEDVPLYSAVGALAGGLPAATYGYLSAGEKDSPWWQALKYGLGGAGAGGLVGGTGGYVKGLHREMSDLEQEAKNTKSRLESLREGNFKEQEKYENKMRSIRNIYKREYDKWDKFYKAFRDYAKKKDLQGKFDFDFGGEDPPRTTPLGVYDILRVLKENQ